MVVGSISDSPLPYCVPASVWGEIDRTLSPLPFSFGLGTSNWFTDLGVVTAARSCNSSDKQGADTRKQMIDK